MFEIYYFLFKVSEVYCFLFNVFEVYYFLLNVPEVYHFLCNVSELYYFLFSDARSERNHKVIVHEACFVQFTFRLTGMNR